MSKQSAGILLYKKGTDGEYAVLLVHPGGPFWAKKDLGAWSIPKGEVDAGEDMLAAAQREFKEEVGADAPPGDYAPLGQARQPSGKIVHAFGLEADFDLTTFVSNTFKMEWPPKSGRRIAVPENDRAEWFPLAQATHKLVKGQVPIIEALARLLGIALLQAPESGGPAQTSLL